MMIFCGMKAFFTNPITQIIQQEKLYQKIASHDISDFVLVIDRMLKDRKQLGVDYFAENLKNVLAKYDKHERMVRVSANRDTLSYILQLPENASLDFDDSDDIVQKCDLIKLADEDATHRFLLNIKLNEPLVRSTTELIQQSVGDYAHYAFKYAQVIGGFFGY